MAAMSHSRHLQKVLSVVRKSSVRQAERVERRALAVVPEDVAGVARPRLGGYRTDGYFGYGGARELLDVRELFAASRGVHEVEFHGEPPCWVSQTTKQQTCPRIAQTAQKEKHRERGARGAVFRFRYLGDREHPPQERHAHVESVTGLPKIRRLWQGINFGRDFIVARQRMHDDGAFFHV